MTRTVIFHSVLGVRAGVLDAEARLRRAGHEVLVVDQYAGRVFDAYEPAMAYAELVGYPALMQQAVDAVADLPDGFVTLGFSNGGGMAEYVATRRPMSGVVLLAGALPLSELGVTAWPARVPAQLHDMLDDPFREQRAIDALVADVRAAGAPVEAFDYPGAGHLFTDASLPAEHDPTATELLWSRVLPFVAAAGRGG